MNTHRDGSRRPQRRRIAAVLLPALAVQFAACEKLLDVQNPGSVQAGDLNNPALATTLVNSALGRFECAYNSYVVTSGILAHEYINASSWLNINTWGWRGLELHEITGSCVGGSNDTGLGAYTPLQQARYLAEEATRLIEPFAETDVPKKREYLGLLAAYAGYSYVLLGEGFCEMAIDQGPPMTPQEVLQVAEQRFTTAIEHATAAGNNNLKLMATLGRARTRLDLGNKAGAASDADQITSNTFVWNAEYSAINPSRENRVFNLNRRNRYLSVEPTKYVDLMIGTAADTRVPVTNSGVRGHDNVTPHFFQNKFNTAAAPIPLASWDEAQLIIAEARPADAVAAIDRLRAKRNLPALELTGGENMLDVVLEERRRQLFSEGHRFNDMLRHNVPFPSGLNHKGQAWGPITCMPLPEQEKRNNPNFRT
jgi:hypothetical protein